MGSMRPPEFVEAWDPGVAGVREVFHARFVDHAYPRHTHDAWTVLIVDDGAVRYALELDHTLFPRRPFLVEDGDTYRMPEGMPSVPLMYSLRARKPH